FRTHRDFLESIAALVECDDTIRIRCNPLGVVLIDDHPPESWRSAENVLHVVRLPRTIRPQHLQRVIDLRIGHPKISISVESTKFDTHTYISRKLLRNKRLQSAVVMIVLCH